jgi:hypothetical protein
MGKELLIQQASITIVYYLGYPVRSSDFNIATREKAGRTIRSLYSFILSK